MWSILGGEHERLAWDGCGLRVTRPHGARLWVPAGMTSGALIAKSRASELKDGWAAQERLVTLRRLPGEPTPVGVGLSRFDDAGHRRRCLQALSITDTCARGVCAGWR